MIGVSAQVVRNWATRGYIQPVRTEGTKTIYDVEAVARVALTFGYLPDMRDRLSQDCCVPSCKAPSWGDIPVPVCKKHAVAIWLHVGDEYEKRVHHGNPDGWQHGEWDPALDRAGSQQPVVYFVQLGELVKIGTTISLPKRLTNFRAHSQHEPRVLLAVPGSYAEEKQVHALFREDRVRGEWFRPSQRLLDFIGERRDQDIRNVHGPLVERQSHP